LEIAGHLAIIGRMSHILSALLPIFALILMGFILRRKALLAQAFWLPCEQLNYFYLFPVLMFSQVARADLRQFQVLPIAAAVLGAVLAGALLLFGWKAWRGQPGALFASVIQGAVRPNTYVGVAAAAAMYGSAGLAITSICIAVAIPLLNVASIVILMLYGGGAAPSARRIGRALVQNPVIVSVLLGIAFNLSGLRLPAIVAGFLAILGGASLPLGLLAVGAGLDLQAARSAHGPVLQATIVKLLLVPLLTLWIGAALHMAAPELAVVVLFNSLPCTPSAYIMAKLLGGDHRLAAGIITVQTALAAVTMPLIAGLAR
jgi:malonate transporter